MRRTMRLWSANTPGSPEMSPERSSLANATRNRRGFSFLEIMMVVMIIGIMLAFVGPRLVGKTKKAKVTAARRDLAGIETALGLYEMYMGEFPATDEGLDALVEKPSGAGADWEQCMKKTPRDPWGAEFLYECPGEQGDYDLASAGPDGKEGTEDDITNNLHGESG